MKAPLCSTALGGGVWKLKWRAGSLAADAGEATSGSAEAGSGSGGGDQLAAACMYHGATVLDVEWRIDGASAPSSSARAAPLAHYAGHGDGALVYGIEWLPPATEEDDGDAGGMPSAPLLRRDRLATCAFYHQSLHRWAPSRHLELPEF